MVNLTPNAVSEVMQKHRVGQSAGNGFQPVIQIAECRTVTKSGQSRVKLTLSDGTLMMTGLVAADCSEGNVSDLSNNSVVQVIEFMVQDLSKTGKPSSPVLILIKFRFLENPQHIIGNPKKLDEGAQTVGDQPGSNGAMPQTQGMQPIQQTTMYANPTYPQQSGYGNAPNGSVPMGQVQQPGAGYGAAPAYGGGFGQAPNTAAGYGGAPQQPPMGTYQTGPHGQPQQQMAGGYGGAPQYQNSPGPGYSGNQVGGPQPVAPQYNVQRGPIMQNGNANNILKISDITPYQNNWTIKGRCSVKSDMRRYNKNGRPGCVFNFDLLDASGEIRCVCFGDIAEQHDSMIQQGKCYTLSKVTAKAMDSNKRKWNQTGHNCEIMLDKNSKLELVEEDASVAAVPMVNINPSKISQVEVAEVNTFVDVIAVLDSCNDLGMITRRDGSEAPKRSLVIRDDSLKSVEVTLWGDKASGIGAQLFDSFRAGQHPVLVIKGARVGDFGGKNLGTVGTTQILIDAVEVAGVPEMQQWYNSGGATQSTQNLSRSGGKVDRRVTTEILMDEHLGSEQASWVKIAGALYGVRPSPLTYPACPLDRNGRTCNKKMQDNDDGTGTFRCETCAQDAQPTYRYVLQCHLVDFEGGREHVSAFGDQGEALMGMPAGQAHENFEVNGDDGLHPFLTKNVLWKPQVFKLKCAEDTYNEESRIKYTLNAIEDVDFVQESQVLISMIDDMAGNQPIKAMQPKAPKGAYGGGVNQGNAFPAQGGMGAGMVPGPFGAGAGGNPNAMYTGNAGYMTQQQQQPGYGMPQQYGMPGHPGMYQPQMGMGYQQQPQQMMQQQPQQMMQQQPPQQNNAMAFL